jgi:hypothetical protein
MDDPASGRFAMFNAAIGRTYLLDTVTGDVLGPSPEMTDRDRLTPTLWCPARPNPPLRGPSRGQAPALTSETADVFRERTKEKL